MSNSTLTHTRTIIVSVCLSVLFGYATHQYLLSYSTFEMETTRLQIARDQINQAKEQRQRVNQYNKAMATFAQFTSQVKLFGLAPGNWQNYDVSVDKSLSFSDAGNILDQLSHAKTYYFMPAHLFIGTGAYRTDPSQNNSDDTSPLNQAIPVADNTETETGDMSFAVTGSFMVRDGQ